MQKMMYSSTGLEVAGMSTLTKKSLIAVALFIVGLNCSSAESVQSPKGAEVFSSSAIIAAPPSKTVKIGWSFPINLETPDLVFKVYHSTDLGVPINRWALLTNIPGTNRAADLAADQPREFFVVTASNYLGESGFATQ